MSYGLPFVGFSEKSDGLEGSTNAKMFTYLNYKIFTILKTYYTEIRRKFS